MSKLSKRLLSWLLLAAMLCTLLPTAVFADDAVDELVLDPTEDVVLDDAAEPQDGDTTDEDEQPQDTDQPQPVALDGLDAQTVGDSDISTQAITLGTKPVDGTTKGNPFVRGTGGSNSFRIPAIVTLSDGTLVAAADARWNTTYDGGGLDTIVSRSTDNGQTWSYTFANYLGDNGNVYNGKNSTCFIDPALVVDKGDTIYMLCDLYPYGVALNGDRDISPVQQVGFNADGYLLLSDDNHVSYNYYLKDGAIYYNNGNQVQGYSVDEYFNITGNGVNSNLFFSDSPFKVVRTGYLYLTKSTDKGATWSAPTLLNLKKSTEQVCLVGPGRGLYTSDGKIVFPVYSFHGDNDAASNSQRLSFIYSTDGGNTWNRSEEFNQDWASESAVVELRDGTLRFFYRNGTSHLCYVDYSWADGWGTQVRTDCLVNSNTQLSAIIYSKLKDGNQVILVSCPTGRDSAGSNSSSGSDRLNGKIFIGVVDGDKGSTMEWLNPVSITENNAQFMYSCMTELKDDGKDTGSVAILYENEETQWGTGNGCYYTMDFKTVDNLGVTFDANVGGSGGSNGGGDNTATESKTINLTVGGANETVTVSGSNFSSNVDKSELDDGIATVAVSGQDASEYTKVDVYCVNLVSYNAYGWTPTPYWCKVNGDYKQLYVQRKDGEFGDDNGYTYTYGYATENQHYNSKQTISTQNTKTPQNTPPNIDIYDYSPTLASTTITFTPVATGTTYVTVGDIRYTIIVSHKTETVNIAMQKDDSRTLNPQVPDGGSVSYVLTSGADFVTLNNGNVTAKKDGSAVVTATVKTAAGATYAIYTYNITVSDGTAITIQEGETQEISVELGDGQYVQWDSSDKNYVGVAGKYDNDKKAYTNTAVIVGQKKPESGSPVVVTGTVYDADGTVSVTRKWLVTVTAGTDSNTLSRHIYVNVKTIRNCTVYYSVNAGPLTQINGTGVLVDKKTTGHYNIMFFAAPDEGYALAYMGVSGSGNQYYTLSNGNPDGTGSDAWPFVDPAQSTVPTTGSSEMESNEARYNTAWKKWEKEKPGNITYQYQKYNWHGFQWALMEGNFSIEQMKIMFSEAIALGCDGATNFTKNKEEDFYTEVQFVAQKLPTVKKEIVAIKKSDNQVQNYQQGMTVARCDTIIYKITVTEYAEETGDVLTGSNTGKYTSTSPIKSGNLVQYQKNESYGTITYTEDSLTDVLTKSKFYGNYNSSTGNLSNTENLNLDKSSTSGETHVFYTELQLTAENFASVVQNGSVTNTVNLKYNYSSDYTTGVLNTAADAVAELKVEVPEYVIDYGLPVVLDIPGYFSTDSQYQITDAIATYGKCSINDNRISITYTPTQVLTDTDYINLKIQKKDGTGTELGALLEVHPANNVMYEETFATQTGWGTAGTANTDAKQQTPSTSDVYGYDEAYKNDTTYSNGSALTAKVTANGTAPHAQFTFTGTGLEIMGECGSNTGVLLVGITNASDKGTRVYIVDTYFNGQLTNGEANAVNVGMTYQIPVVHDLNLIAGEHTVDIYGWYLPNSGAIKAQSGQAAVQVASDGLETVDNNTDLAAFLAEIGYADAEVEFISMNEELGGSDQGVAVYANQLADNADGAANSGLDVYFDGFRVYNPMSTEPEAYVEKNATFTSLYDELYNSYWQDNNNAGIGIVFVENAGEKDTSYGAYKNSGPQNEIYLAAQQTIVFKVTEGATKAQVSVKAIKGATVLNSGTKNGKNVNTQTEMYYSIPITEEKNTVSIQNMGDNGSVLSLVDLKIIGGEIDTESVITAQEIEAAILSLQNPTDPDDSDNGGDNGNNGNTGKPGDTDQPSNGGNTGKPGDTDQPGNGGNTGKPGDTDQPGNGGNNGDNGNNSNNSNTGKPDDPTENWENPFTDVNMQAWYAQAIRYLSAHGIVNGLPGGIFGIENETTRSMVVTMLYRLAGSPKVEGTVPFDDVAKGAWYETAALWAYQTGIVKGYAEGRELLFKPDQAITRQEFVTMLYRYVTDYKKMDVSIRSDLDTYTDKDQVQPWALDAMKWAVDNGIMNGYNEGNKWYLRPVNKTRRSEMAKLFYGLYGYLDQN